MKNIALPILFAIVFTGRIAAAEEPKPKNHYCNLGVFTQEELARLKTLSQKLATSVSARQKTTDGYAFGFPGELKELGEWLDSVRRCCPTLKYEASYPPLQGPTRLSVTGDHAGEFIAEEFKLLFEKKL